MVAKHWWGHTAQHIPDFFIFVDPKGDFVKGIADDHSAARIGLQSPTLLHTRPLLVLDSLECFIDRFDHFFGVGFPESFFVFRVQ